MRSSASPDAGRCRVLQRAPRREDLARDQGVLDYQRVILTANLLGDRDGHASSRGTTRTRPPRGPGTSLVAKDVRRPVDQPNGVLQNDGASGLKPEGESMHWCAVLRIGLLPGEYAWSTTPSSGGRARLDMRAATSPPELRLFTQAATWLGSITWTRRPCTRSTRRCPHPRQLTRAACHRG